MSSTTGPNDWQQLWDNHTKSLEEWRMWLDMLEDQQDLQHDFCTTAWHHLLGESQLACMKMLNNFNLVMEKAFQESSTNTMKQFGEKWKDAINQSEMAPLGRIAERWQKATSDATPESYRHFIEGWLRYYDTFLG